MVFITLQTPYIDILTKLRRKEAKTEFKQGYSEEYRCACLALALSLFLFSPQLYLELCAQVPFSSSALGSIACYAAFLALAYVAGIITEATIPYSIKEWLLYPHIKQHGLVRPGCKIFKKISNGKISDYRFSCTDAKEAYSEQMGEMQKLQQRESNAYQNKEWYKLYQKHSQSPSVQANNLGYLFCRDVFTVSFPLTLICIIYNLISYQNSATTPVSSNSLIFLGLFSAISWFAAHSKAKRLVSTVIAVDLAKQKEQLS